MNTPSTLVVTSAPSNFAPRTYVNPEDGSYQAVCVDVLDLGEKEKTYKNQTKVVREVKFIFQITDVVTEEAFLEAKRNAGQPEEISDKEREFIGKPMLVSTRPYAFSLWETSHLYKDLKAWRGKDFTKEELERGFNLESMIGVNAQIMIENREVGDKVYANILSMKPIKNKKPISNVGYVRKVDRDSQKAASAVAGANVAPTDQSGTDDDIPFGND